MSTKLRSEGLVSSLCVCTFLSGLNSANAKMKHDKIDKVIRFLGFIGITPYPSV